MAGASALRPVGPSSESWPRPTSWATTGWAPWPRGASFLPAVKRSSSACTAWRCYMHSVSHTVPEHGSPELWLWAAPSGTGGAGRLVAGVGPAREVPASLRRLVVSCVLHHRSACGFAAGRSCWLGAHGTCGGGGAGLCLRELGSFSRRWVLSVCHVRRSFKMNQTRVLPVQWGGRHLFRHPLGGMSLVAV